MPSVRESETELLPELSAQQARTGVHGLGLCLVHSIPSSMFLCHYVKAGALVSCFSFGTGTTASPVSSVQPEASVNEHCASCYADSFAAFCNDTAQHVNIKLRCLMHLIFCCVNYFYHSMTCLAR